MAAFLARPVTVPVANYTITDSGNSTMKVVLRLRPENEDEIRSNNQAVAKVLDEHILVFDPSPDNSPVLTDLPRRRPVLGRKHKDLRFAFDKVFDETASQVDIFQHTTKSIVDGVLEGINCSVFAYGATGAGKTYTMLGTVENPGVMFLTMMELYKRINEVKEEKNCEVAVSYCEVYNETIRDLLKPSGDLHLREDSEKGLVVTGLSRHAPTSANDVLQMLAAGNQNRTQHPTDANATSSRSHAVFQVFVNQRPRATGLSAQVTQAKMSLIDLAGSERATVTKNRGERMSEGANINRSLLALGNCINALANNKEKPVHVPYRDSKLTRLLKDSLGGNCRTVMIANISPSGLHREDTYNTLRYADRAKQIKTKLVPNVLNVDYHVSRYRTIVEELQNENSELKNKLARNSPRESFDVSEAKRLQDLLKSVYGERSRLRKQMAELDASERETLLKIARKERDLERIHIISGDEGKKGKIRARIESLQNHQTDVQREKQTVNEYLYSNNESVGRVLAEITRECDKTTASPALRMVLDAASEARKLETENAHLWKCSKHLLKYIKNQQREVNKNESILKESLSLLKNQHIMLRVSNALTPSLQERYDSIVRMAEGEKGVAWADQSLSQQSLDNSLMDVSTNSFTNTQRALFDNFVSHASPVRKMKDIQAGVKSPSPTIPTATVGILTNSVPHSKHISRCIRTSPEKSPPKAMLETPSEKRSLPHVNGIPGTPLSTPIFTASPKIAFTPRNYLRHHPLSENRSHQNGVTFTPRFQNRPVMDNLSSKPTDTPKTNGYNSPSMEYNHFSKHSLPSSYLSPVVDSHARSAPKPAFLPYTTLAAVSKPRAPTPIDEGSWSSSQSSTVSTKLNTVLNRKGYQERDRSNGTNRGPSFISDHRSAPGGKGARIGGHVKRAEPYLLPRPHIMAESKALDGTKERIADIRHTNTGNHPSVCRTKSFNTFEDNFVSPMHAERVQTSDTYRNLVRTSPTHSPSPPSSSVSSQSLSQDQHSSPASSVLSTQLSGFSVSSISSGTRNYISSPATSALHSVNHDFTDHQIPLKGSEGGDKPRCKSPSPSKTLRVSPSRRAKSAENLAAVKEKEVSPVASPGQSPKKSPLSGRFAKAKKLFGIRKNSESTTYGRVQSMNDISSKAEAGNEVSTDDIALPQGVSLSEGDAEAMNATYVVEEPTQPAVPKHRPVAGKRNGAPKKRGIFGHRYNHTSTQHIAAAVEERHRAVERPHTNGLSSQNGRKLTSSKESINRLTSSKESINRLTSSKESINRLTSSKESIHKLPNYLQLTKAAASKRVLKPPINKENRTAAEVNGKPKASRLLSHRPRDRDMNTGPLKQPSPQLVW